MELEAQFFSIAFRSPNGPFQFDPELLQSLVQTGVIPQFISNKLSDVTEADDDNKAEVRREVIDFIRKMIAGTFAIRSYDYFRVNPPQRDDHLHVDPV